MRKGICLLLCVILASMVFFVPGKAVSVDEKPLLSEMSENECLEFVKDNGVVLPDLRETESDWGSFVKRIITLVESDPDIVFGINYTVTANLAEEIRSVVNEYYGVSEQDLTEPYAIAWLEHSEVYGTWNDEYKKYNCYAYVLGKTTIFNPGAFVYIQENPEDIYASRYVFNFYTYDLGQIASIVCDDLVALGKSRITTETNQIDTSNLCTHEEIICLRIGTDDYHFMKYTSDGWLHKPSTTQVLRYKYTPTVSRIWTNECVKNGTYYSPTLTYTSDIIFISYDGHDWDYAKNYNGTHTKSCDICSDVFVEDCDLKYTYASLNCHKSVCNDCGHTVTGIACDFEYAYTGDGTSAHTHSGTCQDCGHVSTGSCSFAFSYCGTNAGIHQHINTCTVCGETKGSAMACTYLSGSNNCRICGHNKNAIVTALGIPEDTYTYVNE